MADILRFKKPKPAEKARGKTLCKRGFHKWAVLKDKRFDSQQGRLVTSYRCERCGVEKTTAH
jgi:ribosomal protein S14